MDFYLRAVAVAFIKRVPFYAEIWHAASSFLEFLPKSSSDGFDSDPDFVGLQRNEEQLEYACHRDRRDLIPHVVKGT